MGVAFIDSMGLVRRLRATGFFTVCLFGLVAYAGAQTPVPGGVPEDAYEGITIAHIVFEPAEQPLEQSVIDALMPLHAGQSYRVAQAREAIAKLYASGRYEDIQIDATPAGAGVDLTFHTANSWFFGHMEIHGDVAEPPGAGQMLSVAGLSLGLPFDELDVTAGEQKIRDLLIANGYFEPQVSHHLDYEKEWQQVRVTFDVKVGRRAHYRPPEISGDLSVMSEMTIEKATGWRRFLVPGYRGITQTRTRVGIDNIHMKYQNSGHLLATVTFGGISSTAEANTPAPVDGKLRKPPHASGIPHLTVTPGPIVEVTATGAKIPHKDLTKNLPIFEEGTVDADLLAEGVTNLREYFQERGYFDVAVDFSQQQVNQGKTQIVYTIQTGPQHRLVMLFVHGNRYFDEKTIRERMLILPKSFEYRRGRYSEAMAARDKGVIEDLYQSNGFRDVHVTIDTQDDYKGVKGDIATSFTIDEGHQYTVASLELIGNHAVDLSKTMDHLSSQKGQPFSEADVAADRDTILNAYGAAGYSDATFEWDWAPGTAPFTGNLKFIVHEGDPQFVRAVAVTGLTTTRRSLVQRQIKQGAGDPLSATSMGETQRLLYDLGIFSQVNMAVQNQDGDEERRVVLYDLVEASR